MISGIMLYDVEQILECQAYAIRNGAKPRTNQRAINIALGQTQAFTACDTGGLNSEAVH